MRARAQVVVLVIVSMLAASPGWAQQHVVSPAALQQAMIDKAAADAGQRDLVLSVLRHETAQAVAERLSLDLTNVEEAVATLDGETLAAAAASAASLDAALSGGVTTVTLSLTALLLIIIIVILVT